MGVNIMSSEQVHARRAGCERPRMMFGRRMGDAGGSRAGAEAAGMRSEQVHARRAGCERPRMMFGRRNRAVVSPEVAA